MIKLTKEQEQLIEDNINLAYAFANKNHAKVALIFDYDDVLSICFEALTKAAIYYNCEKNIKFSTYAYKSMKKNLFGEYNRQLVKQENVNIMSLDKAMTDDEESLMSVIPSDINLEEQILYKDKIDKLYLYIDLLADDLKNIMLLRLKNKNFSEIAELTNQSTTNIYIKYQKALNILRYYFRKD